MQRRAMITVALSTSARCCCVIRYASIGKVSEELSAIVGIDATRIGASGSPTSWAGCEPPPAAEDEQDATAATASTAMAASISRLRPSRGKRGLYMGPRLSWSGRYGEGHGCCAQSQWAQHPRSATRLGAVADQITGAHRRITNPATRCCS